jgi:hypothetical protein
MALLDADAGNAVALSVAQTGNGDSTNIANRNTPSTIQSGAVVITSAIGATPTVTVNIQGSVDGVNWVNVPYSAENTFSATWVVTALTITTAKTGFYVLQPGMGWRMLKLVYSANTNVTLTADAYL